MRRHVMRNRGCITKLSILRFDEHDDKNDVINVILEEVIVFITHGTNSNKM